MRKEAPAFWSEEASAWLFSRYDDIAAVLKDHERFQQVDYSAYYEGYDSADFQCLVNS